MDVGTTDALLGLILILVAAKLGGAVSARLRLPAVFGQLFAGLLLGPAALGLISPSGTLGLAAKLGAIMLMFVVGLETDPRQLRRVGVAASAAAIGGVLLPFAVGFVVARLFGFAFVPSLFVGALLTATSVSITAQTLRELGRGSSREGTTILGAAVIDDVLGLAVLAGVVAFGTGGGAFPLLRMALFFPLATLAGLLVVPRLGAWAVRLPTEGASLAMAIIIALGYAWSAEALGGVNAITGAYLAGLVVARTAVATHALEGTKAIGYGFLIPLFFIDIGVRVDLRSLAGVPMFAVALVAVAVATKVVGCGFGALAGGLAPHEAARVGVGMISRGEVALVVAATGHAAGIIGDNVYAVAVALALATTLLTPVLLRATYARAASRLRGWAGGIGWDSRKTVPE